MLLDSMASKYSLLPSELLHRGTTLDIQIFDIARSYERYARIKAETGREPAPTLTQDQMMAMMERVRQERQS